MISSILRSILPPRFPFRSGGVDSHMACQTARLGVVNLRSRLLPHLRALDLGSARHARTYWASLTPGARRMLGLGYPQRPARTHVDEVDVVRRRMHHRPEQHLVCYLTMEPDVLVGGEEPGYIGPDVPDEVAQHLQSAWASATPCWLWTAGGRRIVHVGRNRIRRNCTQMRASIVRRPQTHWVQGSTLHRTRGPAPHHERSRPTTAGH